MRYFKGAMTWDDILWKMSWSNYMLLIASIGDDDGEEEIETKDASEIF